MCVYIEEKPQLYNDRSIYLFIYLNRPDDLLHMERE